MKKILLSLLGYALAAGLIFFVIAVPIYGSYLFGQSIWYLASYDKETGTVISCASKYSRKGGSRYAPIAETKDGNRITATWFGSKKSCEEQKGQSIDLLVNPNSRTQGVINSFKERWLLSFILLSLTGLFVFGYLKKKYKTDG